MLSTLNNETSMPKMAYKPDVIAAIGQPFEGEMQSSEMIQRGPSTVQSSRFDLSKALVFCRSRRHSSLRYAACLNFRVSSNSN